MAEAAALDSFRNKPAEVSLEVWAAVGAKFKRQGRRGISQSQNICRGIEGRIREGLSLEEVLSTEEYSFADSHWRLCDFISGPLVAQETAPIESSPLDTQEAPLENDSLEASSSSCDNPFIESSADPSLAEAETVQVEDLEEEVVVESEPASSSSFVPLPPASRKRRIPLPANVPQPLRPVIASIPDGVKCFDYDVGRGSWVEVSTFYKPRAVDCGILVVDYHHVLDRLSSAWPVRGAPIPPANINCLRRIKREVPDLKVYCISQLTSPATMRDLLLAFGISPFVEEAIDAIFICREKTNRGGKADIVCSLCSPHTSLVLDDNVSIIEECGYWNIGAIHIAYPGLRHFCSGRFESFPGLLEAEPSILREKRTRPSVRVADR